MEFSRVECRYLAPGGWAGRHARHLATRGGAQVAHPTAHRHQLGYLNENIRNFIYFTVLKIFVVPF